MQSELRRGEVEVTSRQSGKVVVGVIFGSREVVK